jgi:hypothetical protein
MAMNVQADGWNLTVQKTPGASSGGGGNSATYNGPGVVEILLGPVLEAFEAEAG